MPQLLVRGGVPKAKEYAAVFFGDGRLRASLEPAQPVLIVPLLQLVLRELGGRVFGHLRNRQRRHGERDDRAKPAGRGLLVHQLHAARGGRGKALLGSPRRTGLRCAARQWALQTKQARKLSAVRTDVRLSVTLLAGCVWPAGPAFAKPGSTMPARISGRPPPKPTAARVVAWPELGRCATVRTGYSPSQAVIRRATVSQQQSGGYCLAYAPR